MFLQETEKPDFQDDLKLAQRRAHDRIVAEEMAAIKAERVAEEQARRAEDEARAERHEQSLAQAAQILRGAEAARVARLAAMPALIEALRAFMRADSAMRRAEQDAAQTIIDANGMAWQGGPLLLRDMLAIREQAGVAQRHVIGFKPAPDSLAEQLAATVANLLATGKLREGAVHVEPGIALAIDFTEGI